MKTFTIVLTDDAFENAKAQAVERGIDVAQLCSVQLIENFGWTKAAQPPPVPTVSAPHSEKQSMLLPTETLKTRVDVSREFPNFPRRSIQFAQRFVDEVGKFPNISAKRHGTGIEFKPNFVWIEALLQQSGRSGIRVSFYGAPNSFSNRPAALQQGRGNSYSRAVVENEEDLNAILPLVREAWEKRFGR